MYNKNVNSCEGIYNNSLDVRFGKACDNDCSFCIEKSGIDSLGKINVKELVQSTLKSEKEEILILGGEPMLNIDALYTYVMSIRPFKEKIFITTSLPKTIDLQNPKVIQILEEIDGLNCSLHHYNWYINNMILKASSSHDRVKLLAVLVRNFPNKIRVQTNLVKNVLDTKSDLDIFLDLMNVIGVKTVKINELQDAHDNYVSYEKIMGIKLPEPYAFGCQTYEKMKGINIILKRSCFLTEIDLYPTTNDLEKLKQHKGNETQVLYENGKIENGWLTKERKEEKSCHKRDISCHGGVSGCH